MFIEPGDFDDELATGPFEHGDPVRVIGLCEAKGGRDFSPCSAPYQTCDLGMTIEGSESSSGECVEEVDATVIRSSTHSKESALPGAKCNGLYCCRESKAVSRKESRDAERRGG
jgi:hypothetical protein